MSTIMPTTICVYPQYQGHLHINFIMMTSANGNLFLVTGPLYGEFIGYRLIPRTKASDVEFLINGWANNREAGDLRRYRAHYDVTVIMGFVPQDLTLGTAHRVHFTNGFP